MFKFLKLIYQGWKNLILDLISDIKYRKQFHERYMICKKCYYNVHGICSRCYCIIKAKTKAEDAECPMGKWSKINEYDEDE